jgi:hypothetical protein
VHVEAGAKGEIVLEAKNEFAITHQQRRKRYSALPAAVQISRAEDGTSVQQQLRNVLTENRTRVIDLFRDWDEDQSGTISKLEFRRSVAALGYSASLEEIESLFDELDSDSSGAIDYSERELRRRHRCEPAAASPPLRARCCCVALAAATARSHAW